MKQASLLTKAQRFFHYRGFSYHDIGGGPESSVIIAGSGRSGTTWVGEVLAQVSRARLIFEPFLLDTDGRFAIADSLRVDESRVQRHHQLYIPPDTRSSHASAITAILQGKSHNMWCDRDPHFRVYRRRIIKEIRANLFLGYIRRNYPQTPIAVINRNPLTVINSQLAVAQARGWQFDWQPEIVLGQPELMRDYLEPYRDLISAASSYCERLAHKWCIETLVPWRQLADDSGVLFIDYDRLNESRDLWLQLFRHCNLPEPKIDSRFDQLLSSESSMSLTKSEKKWLLSKEDVETISSVVNAYGLAGYGSRAADILAFADRQNVTV
jgi:hypothetical protein